MPNYPQNVHFVSLGCPNNRVDSKVMLGQIDKDYLLTENTDMNGLSVVNTRSFIQAESEESVELILEMAEKKVGIQYKKVVVTGMVQRSNLGDCINVQLTQAEQYNLAGVVDDGQ